MEVQLLEWRSGRLSVATEQRGDAVWITPAGELDMATVAPLREHLAAARRPEATRVVVDLRQLSFMDSSGLRTLLDAQLEADRDGWELAVVPGDPPIQRLFEVTGKIDALRFLPSDGEAGRGLA